MRANAGASLSQSQDNKQRDCTSCDANICKTARIYGAGTQGQPTNDRIASEREHRNAGIDQRAHRQGTLVSWPVVGDILAN